MSQSLFLTNASYDFHPSLRKLQGIQRSWSIKLKEVSRGQMMPFLCNIRDTKFYSEVNCKTVRYMENREEGQYWAGEPGGISCPNAGD